MKLRHVFETATIDLDQPLTRLIPIALINTQKSLEQAEPMLLSGAEKTWTTEINRDEQYSLFRTQIVPNFTIL
jgi:hypothetical protein